MRGWEGTFTLLLIAGALVGPVGQQLTELRMSQPSYVESAGKPAKDPAQPGATGSTIVPGNHSSIAGDRKATDRSRSGSGGGGGGVSGGGGK